MRTACYYAEMAGRLERSKRGSSDSLTADGAVKRMAEQSALFAVADIETTGFSPLTGDRIVEIARRSLAVLVKAGHGTGFQAIAPSGLTPSTSWTSVPSEAMVNSCRLPGCTKAAWDPSGAVSSVN